MRHREELRAERGYISFLYERLAAARQAAAAALTRARTDDGTGLWSRDVAVRTREQEVRRLRIAEGGLCFGRLDHENGERTYVGRIGLFDEKHDYEPLLTDWRAPVARPFYCATGLSPDGITRRRQFRTVGHGLIDFTDEVFGEDIADGDAALLAAVNAPRAAAMRDIVATIKAEQDEIIRLPHTGVVVVEGGPGTGKTAVALHRVAYLLYTRREILSRRGVLVVGPNPGFLRYIGRVLPSLGETDVVFVTPGELFPGLRATLEDAPEVKRVKGSAAMADVLAAAVADRQELPGEPIRIELEDVTVLLDDELAAAARERARATGLPHNDAREVFGRAVLLGLAERAVDRIGVDWLAAGDRELREALLFDIRAELADSPALDWALEQLWPELTPQRFLTELYGSRRRIAAAGAALTSTDRLALFRPEGMPWTASDAALLDEAVELLGRTTDTAALERERQAELEYAAGVMDVLSMVWMDDDDETLRPIDVVSSAQLSARHAEADHRSLAERAAADREWTYGHVVVDEAQELSEMDWRVLMRRCPSRSCTVVGDLAQRESPAGARSWAAILSPYVGDRWQHRRLTINYRTPAEIMAVAADVLAEFDPAARPPASVRANGHPPYARRVAVDDLADAVRDAVATAVDGTVVVIAPAGVLIDIGCDVLTPRQSKGLEFDSVVVVEPDRILAEDPRGAADLYVALTRATQRLTVVHTAELPPMLRGLASSSSRAACHQKPRPPRGTATQVKRIAMCD